MLNHVWIAMAYSVALLGIGYLISRLIRHKSKVRSAPIPLDPETPKKAEVTQRVEGEAKADGAPAEASPAPVLQTPGPKIDAPEIAIAGSELRYYKPFGPGDSLFDVWWKLQSFTSTERIEVRLSPTDLSTPIVQSTFYADGTLHSTRETFFAELAKSIRNAGPSAWRAVRRLSSFGIPGGAPEASYHFFTGSLRMELKGVQVMGMTFTVRATFEPNMGLIPKYLAHNTEYFHCEMISGEAPTRGQTKPEAVVVGFPWSLTGVTLYSNDQRLDEDASKITKAIIDKYAKYVKQDQVPMPTFDDATRKVSVISDEVVAIAIHEGLFKTKITQGRFLEIEYSPFPLGPLDELTTGDADFLTFARALAECGNEDLTAEEETVLDTPF